MKESIIKRLVATLKCGVCGRRYEVDNIRILGHRRYLWYLKAVCSGCQTQALMAAVVQENKLPEVITDLTKEELDRFRDMEPVTADDMLDMHNFLEQFRDGVHQLFKRAPDDRR